MWLCSQVIKKNWGKLNVNFTQNFKGVETQFSPVFKIYKAK